MRLPKRSSKPASSSSPFFLRRQARRPPRIYDVGARSMDSASTAKLRFGCRPGKGCRLWSGGAASWRKDAAIGLGPLGGNLEELAEVPRSKSTHRWPARPLNAPTISTSRIPQRAGPAPNLHPQQIAT